MTYREVIILIPSHSLEDFPTDLTDDKAGSLLNSFTVAWHPRLLSETELAPQWHRSDEPPDDLDEKLIFVPMACEDQIPHGWIDRARAEGAVVVAGTADRGQMLKQALAPFDDAGDTPGEDATKDENAADVDDKPADVQSGETSADNHDRTDSDETGKPPELNAELATDFLALGTCWILLELLTRRMHHFGSYDEVYFERSAVDAARSWSSGKTESARDQLQSCFDILTEARERFYPVDAYLIDLCLVAPDMIEEDAVAAVLGDQIPANFLVKGDDAEEIAESKPGIIEALKAAWSAGHAEVVGGDYRELPSPLVPLDATLWDLERGRETYRRLFRREPTTWARRRFGHCVMTPQLLQKSGFHSALHFLLDDGIYPDREESKMRWEGADSSAVDAYSRIPLAADAAASWLRFPERMAETMESDQVAGLILARWPESRSEFFRDLRRANDYGPVLGRFVTFNEYFQHTDTPGGMWGTDTKDYLAPFFIQAVARREANPISRFESFVRTSASFASALWSRRMSAALTGRPVDDEPSREAEQSLIALQPDIESEQDEQKKAESAAARETLPKFEAEARHQLCELLMHGAENQPGWLIVNSESFARRVIVDLAGAAQLDINDDTGEIATGLPAIDEPVTYAQTHGEQRLVQVELPPAGFAWVPAGNDAATASNPESSIPLAEPWHLQNELFEVFISDVTGGLQRLKNHGRSPNRLSQQIAFRFPRELVFNRGEGEDVEEVRTWYSEMRCTGSEVTSSGPAFGEITTRGDIVDPMTGNVIAAFTQSFRVWRGRPFLEIDLELDIQKNPEGDPWSNYYASRFAWNDSTAATSQSIYGAAQPTQMERIESPHFIEIASDDERTCILPQGLPFHRKVDMRMLDSILIVDGETKRHFSFVVAVDHNYPMQAALDYLSPAIPIWTKSGPPRSGKTGWFYRVDSRCVIVTRVMGLKADPGEPDEDVEPVDLSDAKGFALRLQETEGRYQSVQLELFRAPTSARIRDFRGQTLSEVEPMGDLLQIEMSPFAITDVEVRFD